MSSNTASTAEQETGKQPPESRLITPGPWVRWAGLVAVLSGALGLVYAPFHAAAYVATPHGTTPLIPWVDGFRNLVGGALTFGDTHTVYIAYGRVLPFVLAGFVAGLLGLHACQAHVMSRWGKWAFRGLLAALVLVTLSSIVEYYTPYLEGGFLLGIPGLVLSFVAYPAYGIVTLRAGIAPRAAGWLLTIGAPGIIPLVVLLGHIPIGHALLMVAWIIVGVFLWRNGPLAVDDLRGETTPGTAEDA